MTVLYVQSHSGAADGVFDRAIADGKIDVLRERDLTTVDIDAASGLMTTLHLDQLGFAAYAAAVRRLLDRGGRWMFSGHMLRPFVTGLAVYMPLLKPRRPDYALTRLAEHPIFAGVDQSVLEENRGVAGFYGRGHNPMPPGGLAINGIGPNRLPIDWEWALPTGGRIFSHAGNEFWGSGDDPTVKQRLADRAVAWAARELA